MDAYLIIGNSHTRKASLVRCLSGCFNRSVRDIQLLDSRAPLRLYARAGAVQETRKTPQEFVAEVLASRCAATLCCLLPTALPTEPQCYPDAQTYIAHLEAAGVRIRAIAVLGQNAGGLRGPWLRQFAQAPTLPINLTASAVREFFGWV
jgi:hypothetical protein